MYAISEKEQLEMTQAKSSIVKKFMEHGEWLTIMTTIIVCFSFVHHEATHMNERLDNHIEAINRRVDEANRRSDDLHKEFYELLKEMRK
jgi:cell division protein FtsL